jgi:hypothetical protein
MRRPWNYSWARTTRPWSNRRLARLDSPTLPTKYRRSWGIVLSTGGEPGASLLKQPRSGTTRRSLDDAHAAGHAQTEELLRALRRYITAANEVAAKDRSTGSSNLTDVQRHALLQWRAPDWERVTKWDPQSGTVVKTDTTKAQRREKRVAIGNRADKLVEQLSERLGLSVNGQPHPYLGDIASPRHSDHPDLWGEYARSMTKKPPRGFAFGTDGYPFQRHTRAFCRFAPLFRGTTGHMNTHRGQVIAMAILARSRYGEGLIEAGARPSSIPDWSPIEFSEAATEREIILELARRGITEDEALDASDFAFSWLTDTLVTEQNDDIVISSQAPLVALGARQRRGPNECSSSIMRRIGGGCRSYRSLRW